jgi:RNAse (barnase) inhibitor barstar
MQLLAPQKYMHIFIGDINVLNDFLTAQKQSIDRLIIDGKKCIRKNDLLCEFAKKYNFPEYFGYNWDAFEECMLDLDLDTQKSFVNVISDFEYVLFDSENDLNTFLRILVEVSNSRTQGKLYNNIYEVPPTPFHVIFHSRNEVSMETRFISLFTQMNYHAFEVIRRE